MNDSTGLGDDRERRRLLGEFLKSKRAATPPTRFNLPLHRKRRVPGLRREELALLAGVSTTWYTLLESGSPITVSPALLRRLSDVLDLSALERAYLFTLAIDELGIINTVLPELSVLSSRIAAETFEGEIALVLRVHRALKTQIYAALVNGTVDVLRPHLDETRCPIGLWLHDDLANRERRGAGYSRAARVHAAFHREIEKIVRAGESGELPQVERLLVAPSRYLLASASLERAFATWAHAKAS